MFNHSHVWTYPLPHTPNWNHKKIPIDTHENGYNAMWIASPGEDTGEVESREDTGRDAKWRYFLSSWWYTNGKKWLPCRCTTQTFKPRKQTNKQKQLTRLTTVSQLSRDSTCKMCWTDSRPRALQDPNRSLPGPQLYPEALPDYKAILDYGTWVLVPPYSIHLHRNILSLFIVIPSNRKSLSYAW